MNFVRAVISTMIICAIQNVYGDDWDNNTIANYTGIISNFIEDYKETCERLCTKKLNQWTVQNNFANYIYEKVDDYGNIQLTEKDYKEHVINSFNEIRNEFYFHHDGDTFTEQDNRIDMRYQSNRNAIRNVVRNFCHQVNDGPQSNNIPSNYKFGGIIIRDFLKDEIYKEDLRLGEGYFSQDCPASQAV